MRKKVWIWLVFNDYDKESVIILINQQNLFFVVVCNWTIDGNWSKWLRTSRIKIPKSSLFDTRSLLEWLPYNGKGFPKVSKPAARCRGLLFYNLVFGYWLPFILMRHEQMVWKFWMFHSKHLKGNTWCTLRCQSKVSGKSLIQLTFNQNLWTCLHVGKQQFVQSHTKKEKHQV